MSPIPASVTLGVAIALAASLLGNAVAVRAYLGARDDATEAASLRQQADAAAQECSRGVQGLQKAADDRVKAAEAGRKLAETAARTSQTTAQRLLARQPTVAGNTCASAQAQVDDWLATRRAK